MEKIVRENQVLREENNLLKENYHLQRENSLLKSTEFSDSPNSQIIMIEKRLAEKVSQLHNLPMYCSQVLCML